MSGPCGALAIAVLLLGCERADPNGNAAAAAEARPPENRTNDGIPDLTPPRLTPEAERTEKGARNVLLSFARAIELREYRQAWALLSPIDQKRWSADGFAAKFSDLSNTSVAIATGTTDGAAGSIFYTAPVTVQGLDAAGRPVRLEGEAVLVRVNDVDGATPAQLRWHFRTLQLDWTH